MKFSRASTLECICMVLLASRRLCTIHERLVYYIKQFRFDPKDQPEQRFDFGDLMLTWILIHHEVITGEECDAPSAAPTAPPAPVGPSGVEAAKAKGFDVLSVSGKSLVVRPINCLVGFLDGLQKRCRIHVWNRGSKKLVLVFLHDMVTKGYLPVFLLDPKGHASCGCLGREEHTEPSILLGASQSIGCLYLSATDVSVADEV
ncbi:hypothetical protein R1sor_023583 [Riccia sorocarpa]|uniref:Uncharacterized protein n=1 Tax=Riccia sorocarpa TaxID=122646 RepID=A0ABD3GN33_9MARC